MGYKYQMHTHTAPCSACGRTRPGELAEALASGGYSGCVLTNHFRGGNCGIDRDLPWRDFVRAYEKDWEECMEAGAKYGLDILFGVEEGIRWGREILCYGITPKTLYDHPELVNREIADWSAAVRECGGLCIQAHPFRRRGYISRPGLYPDEFLDGIEVCNAGNTPEDNEEAALAAVGHPGWILVSGADSHSPDSVCRCGIEADSRIRTPSDLVSVLRSGSYRLIKE